MREGAGGMNAWQSCQCTESEIRGKRTPVGIQYRPQCLSCGRGIGNAIPHAQVEVFVEWDQELADKWQAKLEAHLSARRDSLQSDSDDFQRRRVAHMASAAWSKTRARTLKRDGYLCQGCLSVEASQVHHLTYERLGNELFIDLVSLCRTCHERVHGIYVA